MASIFSSGERRAARGMTILDAAVATVPGQEPIALRR
jgi:hypothetical protein